MATRIAGTATEREIRNLRHADRTPIVSTCYLNVDGARRPRREDYLAAFAVLAQRARNAEIEDPECRTAVEANLTLFARWLEDRFERSRARGLVMLSCSRDSWFHAIPVALPVEDQLTSGRSPHLLPLEVILSRAKRIGVALVDHEKMRVFEYHLGESDGEPGTLRGCAATQGPAARLGCQQLAFQEW